MKRKAESLFKRLIEFTKNENRGSVVPASKSSESENSQKVEPVRAITLKGKTIGERVPDVILEISKRVIDIVGSSTGITTYLNIKISEIQSRNPSKDMIKIVNESNLAANSSANFGGPSSSDPSNNNTMVAVGKRVRI